MKIVYMGTPDFAVSALEAVNNLEADIAAVFTQPDRPAGRGMKMKSPAVKIFAQESGIQVYQPERLRPMIPVLREISPDLIIVAAYGKILPKDILDIPPLGCVNIHASLLPRFRGAAPIQRCIAEGDTKSGVTTMYMAEGLDTGDMIFLEETEVTPEDTGGTLHDRLKEIGARLIVKTVTAILDGKAPRIPQDESLATYAPSIRKEESRIDWCRTSRELFNHIRGFDPFPGTYTRFPGGELKLYRAEVRDGLREAAPGTVLETPEDGILVAAGSGALLITELKAPGGRRMSARDYLRGHKIPEGTVFE